MTECLSGRLRQRVSSEHALGTGSAPPHIELVARFCAEFPSASETMGAARALIDPGLRPRGQEVGVG